MARKLTDKQERFAQLIASGMAASAAYRQVYNTAGSKEGSVWTNASKLANDEKVVLRVKELQKECNKLQLRTREQSLKRLIDISEECYKAAKSEKKWTAKNSCFTTALKAEAQISKMCGFDAAEKVDATISITLSSELDEYGS